MKRMQHLCAGAAVLTAMLCFAGSISASTYDMDGDRNLTAFDVVLKKRECMEHPDSGALADLKLIDDHLMGRRSLGLDSGGSDLPDDSTPLLEPKHTVHTGVCTWYHGGITSGRCSLAPIPDGIYVTAINNEDYRDAMLAGAYLRVTAANGNSVDVYVTDTSSAGSGHLDLNVNAFEQLAARGYGVLNIDWEIIPFPTEDPVEFRFSSDSNQHYFSMQVRNHVYPIYSIEMIGADGTATEVPRRSDNYFVYSGAGTGPFTFRLTDIYGNVLIEPDIPLTAGGAVTGTGNFPA